MYVRKIISMAHMRKYVCTCRLWETAADKDRVSLCMLGNVFGSCWQKGIPVVKL